MMTIGQIQLAELDALADARFRRRLCALLEDLRPETAARLRADYEPDPDDGETGDRAAAAEPPQDRFERFVADCLDAADQAEIDEPGDLAAFAALMLELERTGDAQQAFFDYLGMALERETASGAVRLRLAEVRLAALAERGPEAAEIRDLALAARKGMA